MQNIPSVWTVLTMLEWATDYFEEKAVNSPRLSIEWLLAHVLGQNRLNLYLNYDRPLSKLELQELRTLVQRRAKHEPLQYITGSTRFFNAEIKLTPAVLIPRQETEQMVGKILDLFAGTKSLKVLDLGTGSGCIPIALKMERKDWDIYAADISEPALEVARKNAMINEVEIEFFQQDLFQPEFKGIEPPFDLIISNPPYILRAEEEELDEEVKNYEPHLALFCESTQSMFNAIEKYCTDYLAENGKAIFEIHAANAGETAGIFEKKNWVTELLKDYDLKDRFLTINR